MQPRHRRDQCHPLRTGPLGHGDAAAHWQDPLAAQFHFVHAERQPLRRAQRHSRLSVHDHDGVEQSAVREDHHVATARPRSHRDRNDRDEAERRHRRDDATIAHHAHGPRRHARLHRALACGRTEVGFELLRRRVAPFGPRIQAAIEDRLHVDGCLTALPRIEQERTATALQHVVDLFAEVCAEHRAVEQEPHRIHVSATVDRARIVAELLRSHVGERAHRDAALRERHAVLLVAREAEVDHDRREIMAHEHVARLHVAMHDATFVRYMQARGNVREHAHHAPPVARREPQRCAALVDALQQRVDRRQPACERIVRRERQQHAFEVGAANEVHGQDPRAVREHGVRAVADDRRMVQLGEQAALLLESRPRSLGDAGHELDRHAFALRVDAVVGHAHAASAEDRLEAEAEHALARHAEQTVPRSLPRAEQLRERRHRVAVRFVDALFPLPQQFLLRRRVRGCVVGSVCHRQRVEDSSLAPIAARSMKALGAPRKRRERDKCAHAASSKATLREAPGHTARSARAHCAKRLGTLREAPGTLREAPGNTSRSAQPRRAPLLAQRYASLRARSISRSSRSSPTSRSSRSTRAARSSGASDGAIGATDSA